MKLYLRQLDQATLNNVYTVTMTADTRAHKHIPVAHMEEAGPSKRRKRGIQQRLNAQHEELSRESSLNNILMSLFASGVLSGVQESDIASAGYKDTELAREGYHFPSLKKTASVQHGKNMAASITDNMKAASNLPQGMPAKMPYKNGPETTSILLPHELFAFMYSVPAVWQRCVMSSFHMLGKFWSVFQDHPCMVGHPCRGEDDWKEFCIPLALHGDEVPVVGVGKIWCASALQFSWCSLLAICSGVTLAESLFYVWGVFEKFVINSTSARLGTMDTFWTIMLWSFRILATGKWPSHDWQNKRNLGSLLLYMVTCGVIGSLLYCYLRCKTMFTLLLAIAVHLCVAQLYQNEKLCKGTPEGLQNGEKPAPGLLAASEVCLCNCVEI